LNRLFELPLSGGFGFVAADGSLSRAGSIRLSIGGWWWVRTVAWWVCSYDLLTYDFFFEVDGWMVRCVFKAFMKLR
jgi:hypothetical protein